MISKSLYAVMLIFITLSASAQNCKLIEMIVKDANGSEDSRTTYQYDKTGKLEKWTVYTKGAYVPLNFEAYYGTSGKLMHYTQNAEGYGFFTHRLIYDEQDRLKMLVNYEGDVEAEELIKYSYNSKGQISTIEHCEAYLNDTTSTVRMDRNYDDKGLLLEEIEKIIKDDLAPVTYKYTFDTKVNPFYLAGLPENFDQHNVLKIEASDEESFIDYMSFKYEYEYNAYNLPVKSTKRNWEGEIYEIIEYKYDCK